MTDKDKEEAAARKAAYDAELPKVTSEQTRVLLETTEPASPATAVFTGGQPGSGKSRSIVQKITAEYSDKGGIAVVDPDELRPLFSQAQAEQLAGVYTPEAYEAAGTLAYDISLQLAANSRNILRDGSLQSAYWPVKEIGELKQFDYQVEIHIAAVNLEVSHARTEARRLLDAAQSEVAFGRSVDRGFHDQAAAGVVNTARELWTLEAVDRFVLYDAGGAVVLDRIRDGKGAWTESNTGRPHDGPEPTMVIQQHQLTTTPTDLVYKAEAWRVARDSMDGRQLPPSNAEIAIVDRQLIDALDAVRENPEAAEIAKVKGTALLQQALQLREEEPLRAAADAWRRDPTEARANWPGYEPAFAKADELVQTGKDQARALGRICDEGKLRDLVADRIAAVRQRDAAAPRGPEDRGRDDAER